jgi:hypothetical protein
MTKKTLFQFIAILLLGCATGRATVDSFTSSGTWTCPAGVTTVTVECWGGGGAGGSVTNAGGGAGGTSTVGGGGAGGAYVMKTNISVIPGNSYTVIVGTNGIPPALPPAEGARGDGGDSWFSNSVIVLALAQGGGGGMSKNAPRPASGLGGTNLLGSIGDIINLGGVGTNGDGSLQIGGGGGGSGGTLSAGNSGAGSAGGAAVSGGGAGGNGKSGGTSGAGSPGGSLGGGGGGGDAAAANQKQPGGAGGAGKVAISYTVPGATYTWVATSGPADWTSAASWSPSRTSPATNDILAFNQGGNSIAVNVPTETDGKLQVSGNTIVNLQAGGANTLTIGETASDSLTVTSDSQLNDNGANALLIALPLGAKGSISGSMTFSNAADTLTAVDASGITFNSGATFTQNCSGNVFGSGTANSIVFASGSTFTQLTGGNPFKLTAPASVVVFQTGSLFSCQGNTAPSTSGRIYANFEYNEIATNTVTGSSALNMDNLSVIHGVFSINMGGGFNLNGNASVASGARLNLGNTVATLNGKTVTINGILTGTATINGGAIFTITSAGTLAPGSSGSIGTLTFATAPALNGTNYFKIDRNGGSPLADEIVLSSGTLVFGGTLVVTNIGAALQPSDTFTNFIAPSFNNSFTSTNLPTLTGSLTWDTSQLSVNGSISVTSASASPIPLNMVYSGGNLTFNWSDASFDLQSTTNVTGPYVTIPGAAAGFSTNSLSAPVMFFRLHHP